MFSGLIIVTILSAIVNSDISLDLPVYSEISDVIEESMGADAEMYGDIFDNLSMVFRFEFTKDEVTVSIDEDSMDDFKAEMENVIIGIMIKI